LLQEDYVTSLNPRVRSHAMNRESRFNCLSSLKNVGEVRLDEYRYMEPSEGVIP